jgi:dihydroneopterin aldolase
MHIIEVNGIRAYGHHGCLSQETQIGQEYQIDVMLFTDFLQAAKQDDLSKTIDYVTVNQIVEQECAKPNKLIENVAFRIIERIKSSFEGCKKARVKVIKFNPPINGDVHHVSVTIEE